MPCAFFLRILLYNENPATMAVFYEGYADEQKTIKKSAKNVLCQSLYKRLPPGGSCRANARLKESALTKEKYYAGVI